MLNVGTSDAGPLDRWTRWTRWTRDVGQVGSVGLWTLEFHGGRWTLDVNMRTVTNHAMMMHDHLCSPTKFVDNCSDIDFVAGVCGCSFVCVCVSVFEHKHEKSASPYVPLTSSLWVSAVSVCPSPVCVCLCLSLCVRLSLFVSVSVSVCQSVGLSVGLSVLLSVGPSVCLSRSGACREKVSACLCVCAFHPQPTHNHSTRREGAMDDHG